MSYTAYIRNPETGKVEELGEVADLNMLEVKEEYGQKIEDFKAECTIPLESAKVLAGFKARIKRRKGNEDEKWYNKFLKKKR